MSNDCCGAEGQPFPVEGAVRPFSLLDEVCVVVDPAGHRVAEASMFERAEADLPEGFAVISVVPDPTDWFCDVCNAVIDASLPILSVANDALCKSCARRLFESEGIDVSRPLRLAVCPCRPCSRTAQRANLAH